MTNEGLHVSFKTELVVEPQLRNQTTVGKEKKIRNLDPYAVSDDAPGMCILVLISCVVSTAIYSGKWDI